MTSATRLQPPEISVRALTRLSLPIFIGNMAIMGGGAIDTVMAGHLSAEDLAGVGVGAAVQAAVFMAVAGVLNGLAPIMGHLYGARRFRDLGEQLHQSFWLALVLTILAAPLMLNTDLWVAFSHAQGRVASQLELYLMGSIIGLAGALFQRCFISLNAAVSRPKITMYVSLAALAIKIPFNAVFMYGLAGVPALGGAGSSFASAVVVWIGTLVLWIVWRRAPYYQQFHPARAFSWPRPAALFEQARIGVPIGLTGFFGVTAFSMMSVFVARFGAVVLAGHQIVGTLGTLIFQVPLALGISVCVLVSQSLGANSPQAARQAYFLTLKCTLACSVVLSAGAFILPGLVVGGFTSDPAVRAVASQLVMFLACYQVFDALQAVSSFALRGYRVTVLPMIIHGVLLLGVGLGGGYLLAFHGIPGLSGPLQAAGFWSGFTLGLICVSTIVTALAVWVSRERLQE